MKTLGKAIANKIALVLSQYFQLPPGYLMGVIPNHVPNDPRAYFEQLNEEQKVEMLKVFFPSPPVPTISTKSLVPKSNG